MCIVVAASACGTSVPPQQANSRGSDTTSASDDDKASSTSDKPAPRQITEDDLEQLLPFADDIGDDYSEAPDDEEDEESTGDRAIAQACPVFDELQDPETGDEIEANRKFKTEDDRTVSVGFSATLGDGPLSSKAKFLKAVDAINDCDEITFQDDGMDVTVNFAFRADDEFGDFGGTMTMETNVKVIGPDGPIKIEGHGAMRIYVVDTIGVAIDATSGTDDALKTIDADLELLDILGESLESQVKDLLADS